MVRCALVIMVSWGLLSVADAETYTPGEKVDKDYKTFAKLFLANHCVDCHGEDGALRAISRCNDLGPVDEVNAATWRSRVGAGHLEGDASPETSEQPEGRRAVAVF